MIYEHKNLPDNLGSTVVSYWEQTLSVENLTLTKHPYSDY